VSRPVRKVIGGLLIALNFVTLANIAWVRLDYAARMPMEPDPSSGRVQAIIANHGRVPRKRPESSIAPIMPRSSSAFWRSSECTSR
jgi:hypothetical protein